MLREGEGWEEEGKERVARAAEIECRSRARVRPLIRPCRAIHGGAAGPTRQQARVATSAAVL